jgi:hypothetical protein
MTSEPPRERLRHMRDIRAELRKRNDPQARAMKAKLAEIDKRHAKPRRERDPLPFAALRMRELEAIFEDRYGQHLPDDEAGRDCALIAAHHLANLPRGDQATNVIKWLARWAPWMSQYEMDALSSKAIERNIKWKADTLGKRLGLTDQDRSRLCITTIGAIDCNKRARNNRRKQAKRTHNERVRRAEGAVPRVEYEANSLSRQKPWEAEGISRRTWYRHRRQAAGKVATDTSPEAAILALEGGHGPVSPV